VNSAVREDVLQVVDVALRTRGHWPPPVECVKTSAGATVLKIMPGFAVRGYVSEHR
jgi:hypothetical protein